VCSSERPSDGESLFDDTLKARLLKLPLCLNAYRLITDAMLNHVNIDDKNAQSLVDLYTDRRSANLKYVIFPIYQTSLLHLMLTCTSLIIICAQGVCKLHRGAQGDDQSPLVPCHDPYSAYTGPQLRQSG